MHVDVDTVSSALTRSLTDSYFRLSAASVTALKAAVAAGASTSSALTVFGLSAFATGARVRPRARVKAQSWRPRRSTCSPFPPL
jgi:hypothetical protein